MLHLHLVREDYLTTSLHDLLEKPVTALLGVTPEAAQVLDGLAIRTIFDLAYSNLFTLARALAGGSDEGRVFEEFGRAPHDHLNDDAANGAEKLEGLRLKHLRGLEEAEATELEKALAVATLRELANWPPFTAARYIADKALQPEALPGFDAEAPADLLPRTGEYPTEKFTYQSLVLDAVVPIEQDKDTGHTQPQGDDDPTIDAPDRSIRFPGVVLSRDIQDYLPRSLRGMGSPLTGPPLEPSTATPPRPEMLDLEESAGLALAQWP